MKSIAVLVTCHNRKLKTIQCLQQLVEVILPDGFELNIYLVDDGSTDGTGNAVRIQFPQATVIQGNGNLYWNRGMHLAWKTAVNFKDYDYYLWLNDDTNLKPYALNEIIMTTSKNEDAIVVGTTCSNCDENTITYGGRTSSGKLIPPSSTALPCYYFNGNIVLFPRVIFENIGMNDPIFHHALGDFDYGLRARKKGYKCLVAPGILGTCEEHETLATWCNPSKPFIDRWKAFRKPLGHNPEEYFIFELRHKGLLNAIFHYITNHIRVTIPILWKKK